MSLRIVRITTLYVYLEWDKVPGAIGYWIFKNNARVSWTGNPDQTTTRFLKPLSGTASYSVLAIMPGPQSSVTYPPVPNPIPQKADPLLPLRGH